MTFPEEILDASIDPKLIYWPIISVFASSFCLWAWVQVFGKRDNSWIDTMWGLCFVIPNTVIWIIRGVIMKDSFEPAITARMIIITVPVFIWGLRLAIYIFRRHKSEDYRYKKMREDWE
jgi:steroid 5-alpha reductase family enzyme